MVQRLEANLGRTPNSNAGDTVDDGEREIAERFITLLGQIRRTAVGSWTERDDRAGDLRIDFTLDAADPIVAVELTSIRDIVHTRTFGASRGLERRLSDFAAAHRLGGFTVTIHGSGSISDLEPELRDLMKRMVEMKRAFFRPGEYGADEVMAWPRSGQREAFYKAHRMFRDLGLLDIEWRESDQTNVVRVMTMSDFDLLPIDAELAAAIEGNSSKLAEAREALNAETHLVVLVDPHGDPGGTTPPDLPESIDYLWLLLKFEFRPGRPLVWWIRRGETHWSQSSTW
jgi:hypothetical protein